MLFYFFNMAGGFSVRLPDTMYSPSDSISNDEHSLLSCKHIVNHPLVQYVYGFRKMEMNLHRSQIVDRIDKSLGRTRGHSSNITLSFWEGSHNFLGRVLYPSVKL